MCAYSVFNTFPVYPLSAKPLILLAFCRYRYHTSLFERPDFKRMLGDLEKHKANVVIVKDLSRFGREYAQMGMYIENDFEDWNIRFISIGENIDTLNGTDVILMPIINVINSHYPRTKCPNSQRTNRKNRSPRKRNNQWRKNQTVDMYYKFVGIW